ncbi:MAG: capping complex subunit for YIEGIA [Planifilum sp.]|jgi:hypothetical protein
MGTIEKAILAVVTRDMDRVAGGAPIFFAETEREMEHLAFTLEKILDGMAHRLDPVTMIIVRHT